MISDAIKALHDEFPAYEITGGEDAGGYWVIAAKSSIDWRWERYNVLSVEAVVRFTREVLNGRA